MTAKVVKYLTKSSHELLEEIIRVTGWKWKQKLSENDRKNMV
jgi:hypothetical protein